MKNKGFTLIEMMVYIALFSIIMGGLIVAVYQLTEGTRNTTEKVVVGEEMNFILKKIDWALSDASKINYPTSGSDTKLSVDKEGFSDNPVIIKLNDNATPADTKDDFIEFCTKTCIDDDDYFPLTSENITVDSLSFQYINASGGGPEGIMVTLTISGITNKVTKYLKI